MVKIQDLNWDKIVAMLQFKIGDEVTYQQGAAVDREIAAIISRVSVCEAGIIIYHLSNGMMKRGSELTKRAKMKKGVKK